MPFMPFMPIMRRIKKAARPRRFPRAGGLPLYAEAVASALRVRRCPPIGAASQQRLEFGDDVFHGEAVFLHDPVAGRRCAEGGDAEHVAFAADIPLPAERMGH